MFSGIEDVEPALFKRGWSISAIARHLDQDRKTVRGMCGGNGCPVSVLRPGRMCWPFAGYVSALGTAGPCVGLRLPGKVMASNSPRARAHRTRTASLCECALSWAFPGPASGCPG